MADTLTVLDAVLGGGLDAWLAAPRAEGATNETIAQRIMSRHGLAVSAETVRRRVKALEDADAPKDAA